MRIQILKDEDKKTVEDPFDSPRWGGDPSGTIIKTDEQELSLYEKLEWVSICTDRISKDVARPISFVNQKNERIDKLNVNKQIIDPIEKGYEKDNFLKMISNIVSCRILAGNGYLFKAQTNRLSRYRGVFDSFVPFRPDEISPVSDLKLKTLYGYEIKFRDGTRGYVDKDMIIDFSQSNIGKNPFLGIGNVAKMRLMVEGEVEALSFTNEFITNRAAPSLAITANEMENVKDHERRLSMLRKKYEGKGNRGRLMYAVGENVKIQAFSLSQKDMQFLELKVHNRQTIISMFGCTPVVLGIPEGVNRATSDNMTINYYKNINTIISQIENDLNKQFVWPIDKNVSIVFEKWPTGNIDQIDKAIKAGTMTPNRGSQLLGEESDPNDKARNSYYMAGTYLTLDDLGADKQINTPDKNKAIDFGQDNVDLKNPKNVDAIVSNLFKSAIDGKKFQSIYLRKSLESRNKIEDKYTFELTKFFKEQGKRIVDAFNEEFGTKKADPDVLNDPAEAVSLFYNIDEEGKLLEKELIKLDTSGVQRGVKDIADINKTSLNYDMSNPFVASAVQRLSKRATGFLGKYGEININRTTWNDIIKIVSNGVENNYSIDEIAENLATKFEQYEFPVTGSLSRARKIARTEARAAWDAGAEIAYKELGVKTVDVVGCEDAIPDCKRENVPIFYMVKLDFHPNHIGTIVPGEVI